MQIVCDIPQKCDEAQQEARVKSRFDSPLGRDKLYVVCILCPKVPRRLLCARARVIRKQLRCLLGFTLGVNFFALETVFEKLENPLSCQL